MAYVALSRVRTFEGLHLISFDPKSIMVSTNSLKEVNRLRQTYRPDLSLYNIPNDSNKKHKFTGKTDIDDSHLQKSVKPTKRKLDNTESVDQPLPKKSKKCSNINIKQNSNTNNPTETSKQPLRRSSRKQKLCPNADSNISIQSNTIPDTSTQPFRRSSRKRKLSTNTDIDTSKQPLHSDIDTDVSAQPLRRSCRKQKLCPNADSNISIQSNTIPDTSTQPFRRFCRKQKLSTNTDIDTSKQPLHSDVDTDVSSQPLRRSCS